MPDADLHPVLKDILSQPANPDAIPVEEQSPEVARAEFEGDIAAVDTGAPEMAGVEDFEIPGPASSLAARLYRPQGASARPPVMVYFHGGGNIRGSIATHDSTCRVLASAGGCLVVSVDYRLAPEHPFPAAADDALAATRWVAENADGLGGGTEHLIAAGDSAGGNLAAVTALRARDEGGPPLAAQLLIYPVIDHVSETESKRLYSSGYLLDSMPFYRASYLPNAPDRSHPFASPIYAPDHANLPPASIVVAGFDPLHDEGLAYGQTLSAAGVEVDLADYPAMIHGFTLLRKFLPEADEALAAAARAVLRLAGV